MHFRSNHEQQGGLGALPASMRSPKDSLPGLRGLCDTKELTSLPPSTEAKKTPTATVVETTSHLRVPLRADRYESRVAAVQRPLENRAAKRVSYTMDEKIDLDDLSNSDTSDSEKESIEGSMEVADILFQMSQAKPDPESTSHKRKAESALTLDVARRSNEGNQKQRGLVESPPQTQQQIQASNIMALFAKKRRLMEPNQGFELNPAFQVAAAQASLKEAAARLQAASYLEPSSLQLSRAYALANGSQMVPTTAASLLYHQKMQADLNTFRESQARLLANKTTNSQLPRIIPGLSSYDVLFGRSLASHLNVGNRRLLVLVAAHLPKYLTTKDEERKQELVDSVYDAVQKSGGGFVHLADDISISGYTEMDAKQRLKSLFSRVNFVQKRLGDSFSTLFSESIAVIWNDELPKKTPAPPVATPTSSMMPSSSVVRSASPPADAERRKAKRIEPMTPLAPGFSPGPFDVICSRGSAAKRHPGNVYFVALIERNCERYTKTTCKLAKSMVVTEMLDTVRRNSPNGGFVKKNDEGIWCETGDHLAREKIGQCFRDRLHTLYSSSSKAKLEKRRVKFLASGRKKWARQPKPEQNEELESENSWREGKTLEVPTATTILEQ